MLDLSLSTSHSPAGIDEEVETIFQNASPKAKSILPEDRPIHGWRELWFLKTFGNLDPIPEHDTWNPKSKTRKKSDQIMKTKFSHSSCR